jgi:hypothetical protein
MYDPVFLTGSRLFIMKAHGSQAVGFFTGTNAIMPFANILYEEQSGQLIWHAMPLRPKCTTDAKL